MMKRLKLGRYERRRIAQQLAFDAIGAMRWGPIRRLHRHSTAPARNNAGVTYVHSNPKYINVNRWDFKDSQGRLLIRDNRWKGAGWRCYVEYSVPRVVGGKGTGQAFLCQRNTGAGRGSHWRSRRGVYIDDIDEVIFSPSGMDCSWRIGRPDHSELDGVLSRSRPCPSARQDLRRDGRAFSRVTLRLRSRIAIAGNEIGRISRSLGVFKDALVDAERLREEQFWRRTDRPEVSQRRAGHDGALADEFENAVGEIVNTVSSAATGLEGSAVNLSATAERSLELTTIVAVASGETFDQRAVGRRGHRRRKWPSSVSEISGVQVQASLRYRHTGRRTGAGDQ